MEVIIATALLSTVMLSLFQIKSNNIFLLEKYKEGQKNRDYMLFAIDSEGVSNRNKNIYLDKFFNINDDELRRELKQIKIKVKDDVIDTKEIEADKFLIKISEFKTTYSFDSGIKKDIYRFKLEL